MPQLDKFSFFNQIFYLIVFFLCLYLFMLKYGLPLIASAFKVRHYFYLKLKNQQVVDVTGGFNERFVSLIRDTSKLTSKFIDSIRFELNGSYKQLSYFLLHQSHFIGMYDKFKNDDRIINRYRFVKLSSSKQLKEKIKKEKLAYDRS